MASLPNVAFGCSCNVALIKSLPPPTPLITTLFPTMYGPEAGTGAKPGRNPHGNSSHQPDMSLTSNTTTIGLSKDLIVPVIVKICYLQPSKHSIPKLINSLILSSEKYSDLEIFKRLLKINLNSDLFIKIEVFDGKNNALANPVQTNYQSFNNNRRIWNKAYKLPMNFHQLSIDAYFKFTVYEIVDSKPVEFGVGFLSVFNRKNSTLRKGSCKITIHTNLKKLHNSSKQNGQTNPFVDYGNIPGITVLEQRLINYENGDYPRSLWLDKWALANIEKQRNLNLKNALSVDSYKYQRDDNSEIISENDNENEDEDAGIEDSDEILYFLYLELPNFDLPIVFSDSTYHTPSALNFTHTTDNSLTATDSAANSNSIVNSIEIPMTKNKGSGLKVYDPDFEISNLQSLQTQNITSGTDLNTSTNGGHIHSNNLDPIELKFHRLERNINNNSILDKELKPTPQLRDELLKILTKPSNIELTDMEKNLIWKFRYYFSKNNAITTVFVEDVNNDVTPAPTAGSRTAKLFLPKFLKSINWDNDYELDHAFNEIIPNYWTVDKIQIGDALELLSNYFNPYTLTSELRRKAAAANSGNGSGPLNKDQIATTEAKLQKIFKNVVFLRKFAVDRLKLASGEELLLYLLQLVQALKYESIIFEKTSNSMSINSFDGFSPESSTSSSSSSNLEDQDSIMKSPLATFLIEKSIENSKLGNFFYWYVKVENEDQINNPSKHPIKIYSLVLNKYIENLKKYCVVNKTPTYEYLKRQIWFIKKLTGLVELLRTTFKKNEATAKKIKFLRDHLADSSNELLKFPEPFPLPLDPSIIICGCYPNESSVFKSSLAPLKITFKTILNYKEASHLHSSQIFGGKKNYKYGKYPLMFKIGDDLRQDQLVIQIINLMDQLLKNENLDLRLTPYKILATSPVAGLIQFVANETLDHVLAQPYPVSLTHLGDASAGNGPTPSGRKPPENEETMVSNNGILSYLRLHSREFQTVEPRAKSVLSSIISSGNDHQESPKHAITSDLGVSTLVMDNYVKSCAGYCVITYLLGVGDRHLDNLLLSPNGKFWHADFGYILGRDPKPFPPLMKLPIQVIDGMGGLSHENFSIFKSYCFITYTTLRKNSNLILSLFQLMSYANIPDIKIDPKRSVEKVQEKFCLEMTEEEAILHFQNLINDSVNAFLPVVIDRLHSLAQYWRA